MKQYALKFTSGANKGKFVGKRSLSRSSRSAVSISKRDPRLWNSKQAANQYLNTLFMFKSKSAEQLMIVPLWLVEENQLPFEVHIMEYERGWGSKHEGTRYFLTAKEADAFCTDYNKGNTAKVVPDCYWVARRVN